MRVQGDRDSYLYLDFVFVSLWLGGPPLTGPWFQKHAVVP